MFRFCEAEDQHVGKYQRIKGLCAYLILNECVSLRDRADEERGCDFSQAQMGTPFPCSCRLPQTRKGISSHLVLDGLLKERMFVAKDGHASKLFFVATELAPHKGKCGDRSLYEHNTFDHRITSSSSVFPGPTLVSHLTLHSLRQDGNGALCTSPDLHPQSIQHNSNTTPQQVGLGIAAAAFFGRAGLVALRRYQGGTNALGRAFYKGGFDAKINRREAALILQCR